ncbi:ABC transporter permease [Streptococcus sp. CSL10205-OR2]|uniref:ABC transporter permease n=1 Tax=Streptococcus sp. CSL10205-OR2 TaxID=2980558 RepID=UPI0021DAC1D6|nr:ABC transporter permease [Streptococcus sp. CSL10205-OR2]MCU9533726.1 ABC transporter permease [Streptococcus sp. CSL10205-OR2]
MKQLLLVAKESYFRQVKSWAFFFMVISPFIFIFFSSVMGYIGASTAMRGTQVAIVTEDKLIEEAFMSQLDYSNDYPDTQKAQKALDEEEIAGYLEVDTSETQLKAVYHGDNPLSDYDKGFVTQLLNSFQQTRNTLSAQLSQEQMSLLATEPQLQEDIKEGAQLENSGKQIAFFGLVMLMYIIIITYASTTAQEIANEKGTKIMEVIFSSIPADLYFYGRIIGFLGVIVTHVGIYALGGYLSFLGLSQFSGTKEMVASIQPLLSSVFEHLDWSTILFVVLGIFIYVILAALCGSLIVRVEDASKAVQPAIYLVILGFFGALSLGQQGYDHILLKIGSYIPFLSSFFMPIRLINGYATTTESIISLIILLASVVGLIIYIGKSYSGLILQTDDLGFIKNLKRSFSKK